MEPNWGVLIIALFGLCIAAFLLGIDVGEEHGNKAKRELTRRMIHDRKQQTELTAWVRKNWPNEYKAYQRGHADGYQQGVLQSPELEDNASTS